MVRVQSGWWEEVLNQSVRQSIGRSGRIVSAKQRDSLSIPVQLTRFSGFGSDRPLQQNRPRPEPPKFLSLVRCGERARFAYREGEEP